MPYVWKVLVILASLMLWGCPGEEECENKIMQCEDDVEMFCEKSEFGCGEDCHYFTYEYCYETCKDD